MNDQYLSFMNNQQEYRNKLTEIAIKKNMSLRALARAVGLAPTTIIKFIKDKGDITFLALSKIKNYCENITKTD